MYDIRQFKPALFALLLLGMSGFALAAQSPGLWCLAVGAILLNAWLVKTGRFRPLPHFVASLVTLVLLLYVTQDFRLGTPPILVVGEFLVFLQLVKLYEQRSNRDVAQLLILSLLLMVAASINTASLFFGLMLIIYLFLSLYCCLLFHLKVEAENARKAIFIPEDKINPATLRQDQRFLSRSMRRLTGLVSSASVSMAVLVFLFFPRWQSATLLGPLQFRSSQTLTGFSENVSFQQVARITQNDAVVAYVKVWHNDTPIEGTQPLLLRGITLDIYNGPGADNRAAWVWERSPTELRDRQLDVSEERPGAFSEGEEFFPEWRQEIRLNATGSNVLFAMAGPQSIRPKRHMTIRYSPIDETMQSLESVVQPVEYEVYSRNVVRGAASTQPAIDLMTLSTGRPRDPGDDGRHSAIDKKIRDYARRPEVSGTDEQGRPLLERRPATAPTSDLDLRIAKNIEQHLRTAFTYTLDLTDAARIADQDPVVAFLYDLKRGHCEYFAGAMTLMCQSLGMQARMVVGFKCDDYNDLSNCYVVRQNHAHAWVEVKMPDGTWRTYDPTSGRESGARQATIWSTMKHVFDYMEYAWANNVIAYDRGRRDTLIQNVDAKLTNTAIATNSTMASLRVWLFAPERWYNSYQLLSGLVTLMVLALLAAVGWFVWERWRLRRKAARIGLDALPTPQQMLLVRQLGFYDDLLRLLERRGIRRGMHQTPLEFSDSLSFLPAEAYDAIHRLTRIFYRIRFGGLRLAGFHQRRLGTVLGRLEACLPQGGKR